MKDKEAKAFLEALFKFKSEGLEEEIKLERKLWKPIATPPCSLEEVLNLRTKAELDAIRKNLGVEKASSLKKSELIKELVKHIPQYAPNVFKDFDKEQYNLAKRLSENNGFTYIKNFENDKVVLLSELGIIFSGLKDGNKVLVMPKEVIEVFQKVDNRSFQLIVNRNTEWILITHGLLHYYGVLDFQLLDRKFIEITGAIPDTFDYLSVIFGAMHYYRKIELLKDGLYDGRIFDPEEILEGQRSRPNIPYYTFTKEEFLEAGKPWFLEKTDAVKRFTQYLLDGYEITQEEAEGLIYDCVTLLNLDGSIDDILEYLDMELELPPSPEIEQLVEIIADLNNTTRRWILKGYNPNQITQIRRQEAKSISKILRAPESGRADVIDIRTRKRVGRNDLCPCGSGKKYKQCCGR